MRTKSITTQIIDECIKILQEQATLEEPLLTRLSEILNSEKIKKQDIVDLLKDTD